MSSENIQLKKELERINLKNQILKNNYEKKLSDLELEKEIIKKEIDLKLSKKEEIIKKEIDLKLSKEEENKKLKRELSILKQKSSKKSKNIQSDQMLIIGGEEHVYLRIVKTKLKARIDSGATITSISALNIKIFERDGKKWVKFDLEDENKKLHTIKLPLFQMINIKRHGSKYQKRPIVKMRINLGTSSQLIRVSLTDRSKFTYPVLIGRNFLTGTAIVDVSKKYSIEPTEDIK
jgi:hypothetical protein